MIILFGEIYDNRLLVKITDNNKKYNFEKQISYKNAMPMYFVDNVDNKKLLEEIITETCKGLYLKK